MLARVRTFTIDGVQPRQVWVEVDIRSGLPAFTIVGLGDTAVRESRDRIRAAILNSGFEFPATRITANLAPASLRKAGPGFDAAIALAVLASSGQVPSEALAAYAVFGELSLGGELRDSPGALAVAEGAVAPGLRAADRAPPAGPRGGAGGRVCGSSPSATCAPRPTCSRAREPPPLPQARPHANGRRPGEDLADVRGHAAPLLALEIAAAGGHNLLMEGAPGTGKTMLARRLPSILPELTRLEAIEVTRIHSVAGLHAGPLIVVAAVPRAAPHDLPVGAGRRWLATAARARPRSRTTACCFSTSCPSSSARALTRCASRSRTAA